MVEASSQSHAGAYDPLSLGALVAGRYELRRILGRGGAAVVYAAEHVLIRRPAAIKLPLVHPDLRELLCARLRREIGALAHVRHPAIVDIIDAGEWEGLPFLAMELLEGRSLSSLIAARGRLQPDAVIKIGMELAAGLAAVHEAGFVHRDVKPDNVLITRSSVNQVHLCDFGIARLRTQYEPAEQKLTASGAILGTPEYMPLEALVCAPEADHRVDVYALGVTLFECLTGTLPCDGPIARMLVKLSTQTLPTAISLRPDVPPMLSEIIACCLAQDPNARFNNMSALASALASCSRRAPDAQDLLTTQAPAPQPAPNVLAPAPTAAQPQARRVHARAPYVALATLQRSAGPALDARIEDLSEGGVLMVVREGYTQGEHLRLRFSLPISGRVLALPAVVRWVRSARGTPVIGLEFRELPEAARSEIRQYVSLMGGDKPGQPSR
ncbi:MAG TPA: serine/threonine-protein kinase [Polyangiales bacterium]|nr:serine/threonine-protein kinase [Polyangiales bacterium]